MIEIPSIQQIIEFFITQMQTNQWFQTVGFFGILGVIWQYTKKFPMYVWSRIKRRISYKCNIEEGNPMFRYFEESIKLKHNNTFRNFEAYIKTDAYGSFEDKGEKDTHTLIETLTKAIKRKKYDEDIYSNLKTRHFSDFFFIRKGINILKITKVREKLENANNISNAYYNKYSIEGIFAKRVINKWLKEIYVENRLSDAVTKQEGIQIYTNSKGYWEKMNNIIPKNIDYVLFNEKDKLLKDINNFVHSKEWYTQRSIKYKRGYLLEGPPGNGKTTLALALADYYKKPIYILNLNTVSSSQLIELYSDIDPNSFILAEDVDACFDNKDTRGLNNSMLDFNTLLNCVDGAFSIENIITIFTTNHPEKLDPALLRKGRIDYRLHMANPTYNDINDYINKFYDTEINYDIKSDINICMSAVQDACLNNINNPLLAVNDINKVG